MVLTVEEMTLPHLSLRVWARTFFSSRSIGIQVAGQGCYHCRVHQPKVKGTRARRGNKEKASHKLLFARPAIAAISLCLCRIAADALQAQHFVEMWQINPGIVNQVMGQLEASCVLIKRVMKLRHKTLKPSSGCFPKTEPQTLCTWPSIQNPEQRLPRLSC